MFAEGGSLWIVSELVAARPLAALLAEKPLTPYRAAEVASDVLMALRVLHAHGWVHRNITARTVLVCDDGRVMLTGLAVGRGGGGAVRVRPGAGRRVTGRRRRCGGVVGSPGRTAGRGGRLTGPTGPGGSSPVRRRDRRGSDPARPGVLVQASARRGLRNAAQAWRWVPGGSRAASSGADRGGVRPRSTRLGRGPRSGDAPCGAGRAPSPRTARARGPRRG